MKERLGSVDRLQKFLTSLKLVLTLSSLALIASASARDASGADSAMQAGEEFLSPQSSLVIEPMVGTDLPNDPLFRRAVVFG